jgi:hypothetical protein
LVAPVGVLGGELPSVARLRVLLERAEDRAWRVIGCDDLAVVSVECPLGAGPAVVALARLLSVAPSVGGLVIGRSMPVGPRRWVLLGHPSVLTREQAPAFERLLRSLRAPRGEFWRVHGTVLAQAARAA